MDTCPSAEQQHVTGSGEETQDQSREWAGLRLGSVVMLLRPASNPLLGDQGLPGCHRSFRLADGRGVRVYREGAPGARVPGVTPS